jgi:amino acid adenylation domain-containing protein
MTSVSDVQHGIWFTEITGTGTNVYAMAVAVTLDGRPDRPALARACALVAARHRALRVAVTDRGDGPRLVDAARTPVLVELPDAPLPDLLDAAVSRPFDLAEGPLVRFGLARRDPERHVLLVVAHHVVFDGVSKEILIGELATAYSGEPLDPPAELTEELRRTAEAVERDLPAARAYWATRWSGERLPAHLPGLRRTPSAAERGAVLRCDLDAATTAGIAAAAASVGVTRFEFLLSAVGLLLRRYGDPAPVVGVDVSTRTPGGAPVIGPFVNELPVAIPAGDGFGDLARALRAQLRAAYRFRHVPVARAVPGVRPAAALTAVSVSYRRRPDGDPTFGDLRTAVDWAVFSGAARNALHVQLVDHGTTVEVHLVHAPDAIDTAAVERVGGHLRTVLAAAAADPGTPTATLPVLPPAERDLLAGWNATDRPYPRDATLERLFAAQVARTPGATAVVCGGRSLSYAELDDAVRHLAERLVHRGIGAGDLVGVRLPRSVELLVAVLAVGRAGAAYLPIDPGYPPARQRLFIEDARPALVLDAETVQRLGAEPSVPPRSGPLPGTGPQDPAYVIYTSGSTGRPKGVEVPRHALANLLLGLRDALGAGPDDTWLASTSLGFDIAAVELYLPLVTGGATVLATDAQARDPRATAALFDAHGITHAQATPSGWTALLDAGFGTARRRPVALIGGEALPLPLARRLRPVVARLFNVYGPTETTVWSTVEEVPAPPEAVTIGRPLANTAVYVLDAADEPVPVGVEGELVIGGLGVARGYRDRPDLTAQRFAPDPWRPGGRMYRTGDRARHLPDGRLQFLGRRDNQVKIRGHRVELDEIEGRLLAHPSVRAAAVTVHDPGDGREPYLVGYVLPAGDLDPSALRAHLAETLPSATVPTAWVALETLPLTPNGKLDRAALPDPGPRTAAAPVPVASDPVTEAVRVIWQQVLAVPDIADDEDLFDLGAHSLTVMRVAARIQQQLTVELPIDAFYDHPTVAELAAAVRQAGDLG